MRLLSFSEAVRYSGEGRNTLRMHRDFGTLVVICFPDGTKGIRESELKRWMAEIAETRAAKVRAREERKRLKAVRYENWLKSQGLQRIAA